MKVVVNEECIGCGLCAGICPEVFVMNDATGKAETVKDFTPCDCIEEAAGACPVNAIEIF